MARTYEAPQLITSYSIAALLREAAKAMSIG